MKNLYILSILALGASTANAQFTLTTAGQGLTTGTTVTLHNFTTPVNPGAAGAGVTWDFSAKTFDTANPVIEVYTTPTASHVASFPRTNVMMYNNAGDTTFFRQTTGAATDSLLIMGFNFTSMQIGKLAFNNPNFIMKYPYDYNMGPITDAVSGNNATGNSSTDIDGYGTLKLASGNYSTIRTYYNLDLNVTVTGFPFPIPVNIKDYTWFTSGQHDPVMKVRIISATGFGSDTSASANALYTGIADNNSLNNSFSIYPNPAKDNAKINLVLEKSGNTNVEIFSNSGAVVFRKDLGLLSSGNHTIDLSTQNVAAGVYSVRITSDSETGVRKLVIE